MVGALIQMPTSVVILAGGRGERLGQDKATLDFGGQPLIQHVINRLSSWSDDCIVVVRADQDLQVDGARLVADILPQAGVLAGMAAGLLAAQHAWSLVVACDMPFINLDLLRYMAGRTFDCDIVVPCLDVGLEPLHALYHKRCLPAIRQALDQKRRRVISFYSALRVCNVEPDKVDRLDPFHRSFYNINTPEELVQAREWLTQGR